jgi:hypothetical protein
VSNSLANAAERYCCRLPGADAQVRDPSTPTAQA